MGRDRMAAYFELLTTQGILAVEDTKLAADQFSELCHADLFPRVVFGMADTITSQEIERIIDGAMDTFMARYGVKN